MSSTQHRQFLSRKKKLEEKIKRFKGIAKADNTTSWVDQNYGEQLAHQLFTECRRISDNKVKNQYGPPSFNALMNRRTHICHGKIGSKYFSADLTYMNEAMSSMVAQDKSANQVFAEYANNKAFISLAYFDSQVNPIPLKVTSHGDTQFRYYSEIVCGITFHSLARMYERLRTNSYSDVREILTIIFGIVVRRLHKKEYFTDNERIQIGDFGEAVIRLEEEAKVIVITTFIGSRKV